jgi:hypothetical protein
MEGIVRRGRDPRRSDLFPLMATAELDALAADIAEHGLRQPNVTYQDTILDGRNRLAAARKDDGCDDAREKVGSREIGYGDGRDQPFGLE